MGQLEAYTLDDVYTIYLIAGVFAAYAAEDTEGLVDSMTPYFLSYLINITKKRKKLNFYKVASCAIAEAMFWIFRFLPLPLEKFLLVTKPLDEKILWSDPLLTKRQGASEKEVLNSLINNSTNDHETLFTKFQIYSVSFGRLRQSSYLFIFVPDSFHSFLLLKDSYIYIGIFSALAAIYSMSLFPYFKIRRFIVYFGAHLSVHLPSLLKRLISQTRHVIPVPGGGRRTIPWWWLALICFPTRSCFIFFLITPSDNSAIPLGSGSLQRVEIFWHLMLCVFITTLPSLIASWEVWLPLIRKANKQFDRKEYQSIRWYFWVIIFPLEIILCLGIFVIGHVAACALFFTCIYSCLFTKCWALFSTFMIFVWVPLLYFYDFAKNLWGHLLGKVTTFDIIASIFSLFIPSIFISLWCGVVYCATSDDGGVWKWLFVECLGTYL